MESVRTGKTNVMQDPAEPSFAPSGHDKAVLARLGERSLVLVGMPGSGKSSVGRRLALGLGLAFVDADTEIEVAAGMSITDIFAVHGEPQFRSGEARVITRLLEGGPQVLATGGGAFMNANTRACIAAKGISVWLKAEADVLLRRIKRRNDRPLLQTDPANTLASLMAQRDPIYTLADITVESRDVPHSVIIEEIIAGLSLHLATAPGASHSASAQERTP